MKDNKKKRKKKRRKFSKSDFITDLVEFIIEALFELLNWHISCKTAEKFQQKYIDNVEKIGYYSDANDEYIQHQALTI